jgi:hypothetical protein
LLSKLDWSHQLLRKCPFRPRKWNNILRLAGGGVRVTQWQAWARWEIQMLAGEWGPFCCSL